MTAPFRHLVTAAIAAIVFAMAGGCGGSDEKGTASAPAERARSSAPSTEQDTSRVKLAQCLRDQGLDVPDTEGHGAFAQLSPVERERLEAALQGPCSEYQAEAFGDTSESQDQQFLDAITGFTACLRKEGVDVPDPDPSNPFEVLHSVDQTDPRIAKAAAVCQDELAALNGGG